MEHFQGPYTFTITQLEPKLKNYLTVIKLNDSVDRYNKLIDELLTSTRYIKKEDDEKFNDFIARLERALKDFFLAYLVENRIENRKNNKITINTLYNGVYKPSTRYYNDGVEDHMKIMYDHIVQMSNGIPKQGRYNYPSIIQTINFIRNAFSHPDVTRPIDYRTGTKSFGNIFTLCSMVIMSFYACTEALGKWIEVIRTNYYTK